MALKLFNIHIVLFLVSCSLSFDKEIVNYGPILKSFDQINIKKGETSKSFILSIVFLTQLMEDLICLY